MIFKGKNVLVAGTGVSGAAACALLKEEGAHIILFEGDQKAQEKELRAKSPSFDNVEILIGDIPEVIMGVLDMAVLSPGIPTDLPIVKALQSRGVAILGEIELAYQLSAGSVLAITGTNGKTTTTALVGEIMKNYYSDVKVVGNIGIPYTSVARETTKETVTVAEISSFQLETAIEFHPRVAAILNITPDHLNRHHTMESYIRVKESITKNMTEQDICVLNYEDEVLREFGSQVQTQVVFFSSKRRLDYGLYLEGDVIYCGTGDGRWEVINVNALKLLGVHNYENVMAAVGIALSFSVPIEAIREVLIRFQPVEHRIEYVTGKRGVCFYNDSKATNPDAAIQGIKAMRCQTFLIGGGCDKDSEYDEWIEAFDGKVKKLVLIGATAQKIASCARNHGFTDIAFADSLKEAVEICYESAKAGDAVLLSPACASWDMFRNYEERGRIFKEIVHGLKE